mgnify:CR=1 FL=1
MRKRISTPIPIRRNTSKCRRQEPIPQCRMLPLPEANCDCILPLCLVIPVIDATAHSHALVDLECALHAKLSPDPLSLLWGHYLGVATLLLHVLKAILIEIKDKAWIISIVNELRHAPIIPTASASATLNLERPPENLTFVWFHMSPLPDYTHSFSYRPHNLFIFQSKPI